MIKSTFNITGSSESDEALHLFINAGNQGIAFTEWDKETDTFLSVQVFHFTKQMSKNEVAIAIDDILQTEALLHKKFVKTEIIWSCTESILVPNAYFDKGLRKDTLGIVYGDLNGSVLKDELVLQHQLHNVYAVPVKVENSIAQKFPYGIQSHQSSLMVDIEPNEKDLLYCNFNTDSLTVLLRKKGQLQVIQNFDFNTPEDVVYHVLNVCQQFEVDASGTVLTASGMIDAKSNLYNELYKYVPSIKFLALPGNHNYTAAIKEYPEHYFSHLFALASCVL